MHIISETCPANKISTLAETNRKQKHIIAPSVHTVIVHT